MDKVVIGSYWKEVEKEIFSEEEISESDLRVKLINLMIEIQTEDEKWD